jgi:hypothetical protein
MRDLFEMVTKQDNEKGREIEIRLGLRLKVGGHEGLFPVSGPCNTCGALEMEVEKIRDNLDRILSAAREVFNGSYIEGGLNLDPRMEPEELWAILSAMGDEEPFVLGFNGLEEPKRRELAEYILTRCNIFAGKAALFSSRYSDESALME